MRTRNLRTFVLFTVLSLGCAPDSMLSNDGGAGSGGSGGGGTAGGTGGATVTYTNDVQPILVAKCGPCHTTQDLGHHNAAADYDDLQIQVMSLDAPQGCFRDDPATFEKTMPKTMGECLVPSIMTGWMPMGMYCHMTPRPAACVSLAEEQLIATWVAAGMPR